MRDNLRYAHQQDTHQKDHKPDSETQLKGQLPQERFRQPAEGADPQRITTALPAQEHTLQKGEIQKDITRIRPTKRPHERLHHKSQTT